MKNIEWKFLLLSVLVVALIIGMGIFLAAKNMIGLLLCLIILLAAMGYGFKEKRKWLESK